MKHRGNRFVAPLLGLALAVLVFPKEVRAQSLTTPSTVVSLTFDDTLEDQFQVLGLLQSHAMNATFFLNSGRVGLPGFMTQDQILALQAAGNEIGGHTVTHADLPTLDEDDQKREVCNDRAQLMSFGFAVTSFAYPYGDTNPQIEGVVQGCGYDSARGIGDIASAITLADGGAMATCVGCPFAESLPTAGATTFDAYHTATPDSIKQDTTLAMMEGYITQAQNNGGGWVQIVMHHVCDAAPGTTALCNEYAITPENLTAFLDFIAGSGVTVSTVQQVIGGPVSPAVSGPPPPNFAGGETNLLTNPSLEVTDAGVPTCWLRGGEGTFDAGWGTTSDAYDGTSAQQLDLYSIEGGACRLRSGVATGYNSTCPLTPVLPGHSYSAKVHYIATTSQPFFSIYAATATSLTSAKPWQFYQQGDPLPLSASYAVGSVFIPPIDSSIVSLSVGLTLSEVGDLTMDAFSLEDGDTIPPTVTLLTPRDGTSVSGVTNLIATASDAKTGNSGIAQVAFLVDGIDAGVVVSPESNGTFTQSWDTRTSMTASNVVAVSVVAWDEAGNAAADSISVTIDNSSVDAGSRGSGSGVPPPACGSIANSEGAVTPTALLGLVLLLTLRRRRTGARAHGGDA